MSNGFVKYFDKNNLQFPEYLVCSKRSKEVKEVICIYICIIVIVYLCVPSMQQIHTQQVSA